MRYEPLSCFFKLKNISCFKKRSKRVEGCPIKPRSTFERVSRVSRASNHFHILNWKELKQFRMQDKTR